MYVVRTVILVPLSRIPLTVQEVIVLLKYLLFLRLHVILLTPHYSSFYTDCDIVIFLSRFVINMTTRMSKITICLRRRLVKTIVL